MSPEAILAVAVPAQRESPEALVPDNNLIAQYKQTGDTAVLGELYARHYPRVQNTNRSQIGETEAALDITQDTLLQSFRSLASYDETRPDSNFGAWLRVIAARKRIDRGRRIKRVQFSDLDSVQHGNDPVAPDNPAEEVTASLLAVAILNLIPETFRGVVEAVDVQGKSYEEASTILGIPRGTVTSQLHRGRKAAREALLKIAATGPSSDDYLGSVALRYLPAGRNEIVA